MCKVHFIKESMDYKILSHLTKANYEDKNYSMNNYKQDQVFQQYSYQSNPINYIQYIYRIKEGLVPLLCSGDDSRALFQDLSDKAPIIHLFNLKRIPVSMLPEDYGDIRATTEFGDYTRYIVTDNIRTNQIDVYPILKINKVLVMGASRFGWTDESINASQSGDVEFFIRSIGKTTIYFLDKEVILQKQEKPAKAFKKAKTEKHQKTKIVTLLLLKLSGEGY